MAYDGSVWNESEPTNGTLANEIDDVARDMKIGVRGRMALEHVWPTSQTGTADGGYHTAISLQTQTSAPTVPVAGTSTQAGIMFASSGYPGLILYRAQDGVTRTLGIPTGVIQPFGGTSTLPGTYFCTGGAFSRSADAALFSVLGTVWGSGDGSTTFNVPDMQGFVPVGKSGGGMFTILAATTGETAHTLTIAEMPQHTHTVAIFGSTAAGSNPGSGATQAGQTNNTSAVGGDGSHNNVQPSRVVNFLVGR